MMSENKIDFKLSDNLLEKIGKSMKDVSALKLPKTSTSLKMGPSIQNYKCAYPSQEQSDDAKALIKELKDINEASQKNARITKLTLVFSAIAAIGTITTVLLSLLR